MFDTFQESLYSNDPAIGSTKGQSAMGSDEAKSNRSNSAIDAALGRQTGASAQSDNNQVVRSDAGNNKVMYEESILMTLLGPEYMQFISEETGEWINEDQVVEKF